MRIFLTAVIVLATALGAVADPLNCNLGQYKAQPGLTASASQDTLTVTWTGAEGTELRAQYAVEHGQPVVRELAARKHGGQWVILGQSLTPYFKIHTGHRRVAYSQLSPLKKLGVDVDSKQVQDREAWFTFWDAPFVVPGVRQGEKVQNPGLPRTQAEIHRVEASFNTTACDVKTDGARVEVNFPGFSAGIFSGGIRFTSYRGTNLLRLEAIASTNENFVAYKYDAGLTGFSTASEPRVTWLDTGGNPQEYQFGGPRNDGIVSVRAKNRIMIAEGNGGSVAVFPPPTVFFPTREVDTNLGYVWYRKDSGSQ